MGSSVRQLQRDHAGRVAANGPPPGSTLMMATGLECSYPTVEGGKRRDELEGTGHYAHWREDFELCRSIGARYVRYGLPYYRMHLGPGRYDWSFADEVLPVMWDLGLIPIADLCHFGVPDWIGGFGNRDWPAHFAEYAAAFADRYPWIKFYTPVNEMLVCARMSAFEGAWNEQEKSNQAMVAAHANECRANMLAIDEILKRRPDAVFIQSEIAEVFLERWPQTRQAVEFRNHFRFLTFDYLFGSPPDGDVLDFLYAHGFTRSEFEWFMAEGRRNGSHCVLGMDYYARNERCVETDGSISTEGAMLGWNAIAREYYERYRRPMMLTETNTIQKHPGDIRHWLLRTWHQAQHLRDRGVPVIGYTWYSLTDQIDWDIALREIRGTVNANGLFTLDRKPRDGAEVFAELARLYGDTPLVHGVPAGLPGSGATYPR